MKLLKKYKKIKERIYDRIQFENVKILEKTIVFSLFILKWFIFFQFKRKMLQTGQKRRNTGRI